MAEKKKFDPKAMGLTAIYETDYSNPLGEGAFGEKQTGWSSGMQGGWASNYDLNGNLLGKREQSDSGWVKEYDPAGKLTNQYQSHKSDGSFGGMLSEALSDPSLHQLAATIATVSGHPEIAAAIKGVSRAGQDGNIGAGLTEGAKTYAIAKGMEYLTSPGADELAGPPEPTYTGADPANPMQQDPATMQGQVYDSTGTPATTRFTPDVPGTPPTNPSLTLKDFNTGLKVAKNPGSTALDWAAKNSGIDKDILELATLTGVTKPLTDLAGRVDKGAKDIINPTGSKPAPTKDPKTGENTGGSTPYNIPPALLALIAGQLGQQQPQQPVQTPTVDLKSVGEFDPFGEFNYGSRKTANAAQGGSISDLIRMLRS